MTRKNLRVLFLVEGFTDIRFVSGLSEICDLTMLVPARSYRESGLKERVEGARLRIRVEEIPGKRLGFQVRSIIHLLRTARQFDLILAQEVLRGALNANLAGALRRVPVITYMGIAPLEYFRCRRERGQMTAAQSLVGRIVIRTLLEINGRMARRCLAMGPYLREVASRYCPRAEVGLYYGIDTARFAPVSEAERVELRQRLNLPADKFIVLFSSRISHEKDPETVLNAVALARARGVDAVVLNLGGGHAEFGALAKKMALPCADDWVIGRPAAHPISEVFEYFRAADALVQASLAEGAAYSTLEALSAGVPVVATAVGGMAIQLQGFARMVARRDASAMAREIAWVAHNRAAAREQALRGREYVIREWRRDKAFADLRNVFVEVCQGGGPLGSNRGYPTLREI